MTLCRGSSVDNINPLKPKSILGVRHVQTILLFLAMVLAFSMRVNMSIAIVAMMDTNEYGTFDWSMQKQSIVLSSFFWGYIILQIPAGQMAAKYGSCIFITIVVAVNAAISFLIPLAAYHGGWQAVCACRIFQGLTQGFLYPVTHDLIGKWVPVEEMSRLGSFIYSGGSLGTALQLLISGFIIKQWGWPAIFYVNGTLGALWTVAYVILGADSPQKSKMISDEEKLYIQSSLGQVGEQKRFKTPWKALWTSLPFYALIIAQSGHSWGHWTLMTEMPSYMKQILEVDIIKNGTFSALPYLSKYLLSFAFGFASDYVLNKKLVSLNAARKISNTIGKCGPGFALIGLSYVPAGNVTLAVTLLNLVVGLNAGHYTGFMLVHIDMAPNFAGVMMGICNFFLTVVAIIAPLIAGFILQNESDVNQWRQVFYVSSAVYIATNLFFVIFGTSERQPWNEPEEINESGDRKTEGLPRGEIRAPALIPTFSSTSLQEAK